MSTALERLRQRSLEGKTTASDLSLRGTGITTREVERSEKRREREVGQSLEKGAAVAGRQAEEQFREAVDATIDAIQRDAGAKNIILDASQLRALAGILRQKVCCLIGPAGVGKTTLERIIIGELVKHVKTVRIENVETDEYGEQETSTEYRGPGIAVAAMMGRAAQQSRRSIGDSFGIPIKTIHSLIGFAPTMEEYQAQDLLTGHWFTKTRRIFRPTFGVNRKLPFTVYIIDEGSTVGVTLWNQFIDAIHPSSHVILVGDIHQLPPVMDRSVLGYALRKWPVFELTTIHRQAEGNAIIANAHRVLKGQPLKAAENFHLFEAPGEASSRSSKFAVFARQAVQIFHKKGMFDPYKDVIIVPNSDPQNILSSVAQNTHFMTMFNPERKENGVIINKRIAIHTGMSDVYFAIGDKVMILNNINTVNPPITNGMIGIVENIAINGRYDQKRAQVDVMHDPDAEKEEDWDASQIEIEDLALQLDGVLDRQWKEEQEKPDESTDQRQSSHTMTVKFETGQVLICTTAGDYRKITFGYAMTCHKMIGGECRNIVIAIHSSSWRLLTQEWLYTAITRAKENVFILYNKKALQQALKTQKIKGNTLLEKIQSYAIECKAVDMENIAAMNDPWNVDRTKFPILFNPVEVTL